MPVTNPLPARVFKTAEKSYKETSFERVRTLYNRHRAVFAEFVVAALLPASVEQDPSAAWDVTWQLDGQPVHIQVKCSGERLPHHPGSMSPPVWTIEKPAKAWNPATGKNEDIDEHQCDVFVLARHEGEDIEAGWTFRAALPDELVPGRRTGAWLDKHGLVAVQPNDLAVAVQSALARRAVV